MGISYCLFHTLVVAVAASTDPLSVPPLAAVKTMFCRCSPHQTPRLIWVLFWEFDFIGIFRFWESDFRFLYFWLLYGYEKVMEMGFNIYLCLIVGMFWRFVFDCLKLWWFWTFRPTRNQNTTCVGHMCQIFKQAMTVKLQLLIRRTC